MYHFSIQDIENLSGIKAHTLRMWEQRYQICLCKRKESQHRYYDNNDLKHILRIAYLYKNNYKISRIVQLSTEEIIQLAMKNFGNDEHEVLVNQLVEASMDYNQEQFEKSLRTIRRNMGLEKAMERVIYPFLHKIGILWMTDHVLPAQEHFCSHLVQKLIISATEALPRVSASCRNRLLLFTPEGEAHELPILFVQYIARKKGIKTIFLGKEICMETLQCYCKQQPVTHLYFHLITDFTSCGVHAYLQRLSACFADKQIIASGPVLCGMEEIPSNVQIIRSLEEAIAFQLRPRVTV